VHAASSFPFSCHTHILLHSFHTQPQVPLSHYVIFFSLPFLFSSFPYSNYRMRRPLPDLRIHMLVLFPPCLRARCLFHQPVPTNRSRCPPHCWNDLPPPLGKPSLFFSPCTSPPFPPLILTGDLQCLHSYCVLLSFFLSISLCFFPSFPVPVYSDLVSPLFSVYNIFSALAPCSTRRFYS